MTGTLQPIREFPGPAGTIEAVFDLPVDSPRAVAVVAHPHPELGGTLQTKAVYHVSKALTRIGVASLRFNFRGVGRSSGVFDAGQGERDDFRAAVAFAADRYPGIPIWVVGMSFGAWIATTVGAEDARVSLLVAVAPPVELFDFGPMKESAKPKFVIHGELDSLVSIKAVRKFYGELTEPRELAVIEGADHAFDGKASLVAEAIEDLLGDFDVK